MDLNDQINLDHLLFLERKCRSCNQIKSLLDDFYISYRDRGSLPSSYSYECKECTIDRIKKSRKNSPKKYKPINKEEYPDW